MTKDFTWLFNLKQQVTGFLGALKGKIRKGFYHYSLTGDYFGERCKWGLGNSVFFLKIIYILSLENQFKNEIKRVIAFIKSFQAKDAFIYDPLIKKISYPRRLLNSLKSLDIKKINYYHTKIAESRQAFSALILFNEKPTFFPFPDLPTTKKDTENFLKNLNWKFPWEAGSYFSHLLFFLRFSNLNNKDGLIQQAINWINQLQHRDNGFWYDGNPPLQQKINGAMKIITGLQAADKLEFNFAKNIIDNLLIAKNDTHACDNFNIIYVLQKCNEVLNSEYKLGEIKNFMLDRLDIYRTFYYDKIGGFSFLPHQANKYYYGAKISKGLDEPDIHGTVMFLWGICLIAQVLDLNGDLNLKEFLT